MTAVARVPVARNGRSTIAVVVDENLAPVGQCAVTRIVMKPIGSSRKPARGGAFERDVRLVGDAGRRPVLQRSHVGALRHQVTRPLEPARRRPVLDRTTDGSGPGYSAWAEESRRSSRVGRCNGPPSGQRSRLPPRQVHRTSRNTDFSSCLRQVRPAVISGSSGGGRPLPSAINTSAPVDRASARNERMHGSIAGHPAAVPTQIEAPAGSPSSEALRAWPGPAT